MKKNVIIILIVLSISMQCKKTNIPISNVISNFTLTSHTLLADGTTKDTATVELNPDASGSKRMVAFKITGDLNSEDSAKFLNVTALFINNHLIAQISFISPLKAGKIYISTTPALDSFDQRNFTLNDSVTVYPSIPTSIVLRPSGFAIETGLANEVIITANLKNLNQNPVSTGNKVSFVDSFENSIPANGEFRSIIDSSNASSIVSVGYSLFSGPIGSKIIVKGYILDSAEHRTSYYDSTIFYITK